MCEHEKAPKVTVLRGNFATTIFVSAICQVIYTPYTGSHRSSHRMSANIIAVGLWLVVPCTVVGPSAAFFSPI